MNDKIKTVTEAAREVPIKADVDIVVIGGGCTGVCAAVRAARLGAKVALIERSNAFGGVATNGFVCVWHTLTDTTFKKKIIGGLTDEILTSLSNIPGGLKVVPPPENTKFRAHVYANYHLNTEELKIELDRLVCKAGVMPFLHTVYSAPYIVDGNLRGVYIENNNGRSVILGKYFIDASSDGLLGVGMGMETYRHETLQPATTAARIHGLDGLDDPNMTLKDFKDEIGCHIGWDDEGGGIQNLQSWFKSNINADCSDADQMTEAEILGREQVRRMMDVLRREYKNGDKLRLAGLSSVIGVRETRQLKCSYQTTVDDICYGRHFDDAVVYCAYPVDIHHQDRPTAYRYLDGVEEVVSTTYEKKFARWRDETPDDPTYWQMPFRSMLPQSIPNLLICGRSMDLDKGAMAAVRVMISLNQAGEAAGVASYLALKHNCSLQELDIKELRQTMADGGSIMLD